jgi:hypothetical protein
MALPKIDVPMYEATLPSNNQVVKFRPFLVKEQKLLLMSAQATETKEIIESIKQILRNCIITELDIDTLPVFDLEFLFLNLRARSVNEIVDIKYRCNNQIKGPEDEEPKTCNGFVEYKIDVLQIHPEFAEGHTNKIQISDNLGLVLKYPTFEMMQKIESKTEDEAIYDLLIQCIEYIYDADNLYYTKDTEREELLEFIDNLQQKHLEEIKKFFDTMPKVKKDLDFKCPKCGMEDKIFIEGVQNFFE